MDRDEFICVIGLSMATPFKKTRGFTLIEVVVAVAVISIGFFGIYSLHIRTIAAADTVRFYLKAPSLAHMKISELDAETNEISEATGDFDEKFEGFSWKILPLELESENHGELSEKLVAYELEVSSSSESYSLTVYRFRVRSE